MHTKPKQSFVDGQTLPFAAPCDGTAPVPLAETPSVVSRTPLVVAVVVVAPPAGCFAFRGSSFAEVVVGALVVEYLCPIGYLNF